MDPSTFPTKGNLIAAKNTLKLSEQGYDLMDKKRNVLIREIIELNQQAEDLQENIERVFKEAYKSLQSANIQMGISEVEAIGHGMPIEDSVKIRVRSVMGVEIPMVSYDASKKDEPLYGFGGTDSSLDDAIDKFGDVKEMILRLAMIENAAYRLAVSIKKTQKRANALKNVTIPKYEALTKMIQETLEERERDDFTRLKVIKSRK